MNVPGFVYILFWVGICTVMVVSQLEIECFPNATIIMENPKPDYYTNGVANDSDRVCSLTYSTDKSKIYINDCALGNVILVSLTNRTTNDVIMGGHGSTLYYVQCRGVGSGGVNRSIMHTLLPDVPLTTEDPQTEHSYAEMVFREGSTSGSEISTSSVGTRIVWSMECAGEHFLQIMNCTAYAGQTTSGSYSVVLIEDGCSKDPSIVTTHFESSEYSMVGGEKRYYADLYVFKFLGHDYVTFVCTVKVCPASDNICNMTTPCTSSGRRRRYEEVEPFEQSEYRAMKGTIRVFDTISSAADMRITHYLLFLAVSVIYFIVGCC